MHDRHINAIYSAAKGTKPVYVPAFNGRMWVMHCHSEFNLTVVFGDQGQATRHMTFVLARRFVSRVNHRALPSPSSLSLRQSHQRVLSASHRPLANTGSSDIPYIQLLSTTDLVTAHAEFVEARLNGIDHSSPEKSFFQRHETAITVGCSLGGAALPVTLAPAQACAGLWTSYPSLHRHENHG